MSLHRRETPNCGLKEIVKLLDCLSLLLLLSAVTTTRKRILVLVAVKNALLNPSVVKNLVKDRLSEHRIVLKAFSILLSSTQLPHSLIENMQVDLDLISRIQNVATIAC